MRTNCFTKLVCTIGPASESPEVITEMLLAGMSVARLNFSHGEFDWHGTMIRRLRECAAKVGRSLAILADLPGVKIRVGCMKEEGVQIVEGSTLILTTEEVEGDTKRIQISLKKLPSTLKPGDQVFINDGIIHLEIMEIEGNEARCRVLVGGELRSRKGINLPGIDLDIDAITEQDLKCLKFALNQGVDAIGQSFVTSAKDVECLRNAAAAMGFSPFIIAKIERSQALEAMEAIMYAADGIMIGRGDLGVEIPLETIALAQKELIYRANLLGKPIITATHMLDSMTCRLRPTRAEVSDVANAILDGTDAVMLSEESATGSYPVEAVTMLSKIAVATEASRPKECPWEHLIDRGVRKDTAFVDYISRNVNHAVDHLQPDAVVVPTSSGYTARMVSRFKLPLWIAAVTPSPRVSQGLIFSYGVEPVLTQESITDWTAFSKEWIKSLNAQKNGLGILLQGPSPSHPETNPSMEIILPDKG
ncbi:MAG TPA: pyruvate kinase [Candidatus Hydrogenedentes bacterium]|nr:MAG: Pyruvate kinase [Candidatus Hydrogenedentes bacterium ADurb.Bin170]HNZ47876.1 pyruvate kinase [Candidatus Hydrogenedentota bacterium]HPX85304.1 pyruvate kinase [Candidatus Hydrogenedentota bacterium]HQB04052.1 pyruvate kinase [Candidatus Hydrogenedentota bacterium]